MAVITGTVGADYIVGTASTDTLYGLEGNDILIGDGGADDLYGGAGNDIIHGGEGNDSLHGGKGDDYLLAGSGNDHLWGDVGKDTLMGFDGADYFHASTDGSIDIIADLEPRQDKVDGEQLSYVGDTTYVLKNLQRVFQVTGISPATYMKDHAKNQGIRLGTAVRVDALQSDANYASLINTHYGHISVENAMKWDTLRPSPLTWDWSGADYLVDWAIAHGKTLTGHSLLWHNQVPTWLQEANYTPSQLMTLAEEHVRTVVSRYKGKIAIWDVANEFIVGCSGGQPIFRQCIWSPCGWDLLIGVCHWVAESDPNAVILYNDYGAEELCEKSDGIYAMAQRLLSWGAPLQAIGFQSHLSVAYGFNYSLALQNFNRFANLGLQLHITELDVQTYPSMDASLQTQIYKDVARVALDSPMCKSLTTWGCTDLYSWIPQLLGCPDQPLPFNVSYQPKAAYSALLTELCNYRWLTPMA